MLQETPLQWAARQGHLDIVLALLSAGCDPCHVNSYGQNAVHLAAQLDQIPVLLVLLAHGVPVNVRDLKASI